MSASSRPESWGLSTLTVELSLFLSQCFPAFPSVKPNFTPAQREFSFSDAYFCAPCLQAYIVSMFNACKAGDLGLIPGWGRSTGEGTGYPLQCSWAALVAQLVKNSPAMQETWVRSLGWEDPLQKGTATHLSILAWRIPWTVKSMGCKESDTTEGLSLSHLIPTSYHIAVLLCCYFYLMIFGE